MQDLIDWKNKKDRKPLLLYGARQVGKTHLVKEFAEIHFDDSIYINLETIVSLVILLKIILIQNISLRNWKLHLEKNN